VRRGAIIALCAMVLVGCGAAESAPSPPDPKPSPAKLPEPRPEPKPRPSHCPPAEANCRTASGRILYLEAVDPDGDGDAHFVLTVSKGVTLPGISVIDVAKGMRPHPLPRPGDLLSAAGRLARGSYGQRQIQATELHVARLR
jgi:hypothetical protein